MKGVGFGSSPLYAFKKSVRYDGLIEPAAGLVTVEVMALTGVSYQQENRNERVKKTGS